MRTDNETCAVVGGRNMTQALCMPTTPGSLAHCPCETSLSVVVNAYTVKGFGRCGAQSKEKTG